MHPKKEKRRHCFHHPHLRSAEISVGLRPIFYPHYCCYATRSGNKSRASSEATSEAKSAGLPAKKVHAKNKIENVKLKHNFAKKEKEMHI